MTTKPTIPTAVLALSLAGGGAFQAASGDDRATLERGRYLVSIGGCNDCHTPGFPESGGTLPQSDWLTGSPVGFKGPWGTTYPANLRLVMQTLSEEQWIARARGGMRPPMPWYALRDLTDEDLKAVRGFVLSLGPKGEPAPAYVPPDQAVTTPYIDFVPKNLPAAAHAMR